MAPKPGFLASGIIEFRRPSFRARKWRTVAIWRE